MTGPVINKRIANLGFALLLFEPATATATVQRKIAPIPQSISTQCPTLDAKGKAFPVVAPQAPSLTDLTGMPEPGDAAVAFRIVHRFEGGAGDPYLAVSERDIVSIGRSQWNAGSGSLFGVFLAGMGETELAAAPAALRPDLDVLRASVRASDPGAQRVLARWTTSTAAERKIGGILPSVRRDLQIWLGSAAMRAHQDRLAARDLTRAYRLAQAWVRDSAGGTAVRPVDARTLTYFHDVVTYSGGTAGVWVPHVRRYRALYATTAEMLAGMTAWLEQCALVVRTHHGGKSIAAPYRRLYGVDHALRNIRYLEAAAGRSPELFDEQGLDLLALGFLRARQSAGSDTPHGFPGIYQADVFYRRAIEAIGSGYFKGAPNDGPPVDIYQWARSGR